MSEIAAMLPYFVVIAMASTAVVLFAGLWTMGSSDEAGAGYSNLLMRWWVGMQGLTVGLLAINIARPLPLRIPTLTSAVLPAGWYVYAGNACGRGGIRARVTRHLRRGKPPHWHVDRLTDAAAAILAMAFAGGHECALVQALLARPRFHAPVAGFGSTDCRACPTHLLAVGGPPPARRAPARAAAAR